MAVNHNNISGRHFNVREAIHFMGSILSMGATMKKNSFLYVAVAILLVISVAFIELGSSPRNASRTDSINGLSYGLGFQIGRNLGKHNIDINMTMFLNGLNDGRQSQLSRLTSSQITQSIQIVKMILGCQITEEENEREHRGEFRGNSYLRNRKNSIMGVFEY